MSIHITQKPAANGNWRRGSGIPRAVTGIVLHIAEGSEPSASSWFLNPASRVSAHFLVTTDGRIVQYVGIHDIAYHAGLVDQPTWEGLQPGRNPNEYTVGIEHEGDGVRSWPEKQLIASAILGNWLINRFDLNTDPQHVALHREIRRSKPCPGPAFDRVEWVHRVKAAGALFNTSWRFSLDGVR